MTVHTRWEAPEFTSVSFTVPNDWKAGRIWVYSQTMFISLVNIHGIFKARRNCDFSVNPGPNSCLDGGCNGGLLCDPHTGTVRLISMKRRMLTAS